MPQLPPSSNDPQDTTRLLMFIAVAMTIFLGYSFFFEKPQQHAQPQQAQQQQTKVAAPEVSKAQQVKSRPEALAATQRVAIHGDKLTGSINLAGARIDDLSLVGYYTASETLHKTRQTGFTPKQQQKEYADDHGFVELLSPSGTVQSYYIEAGWTSDDKSAVLPDEKSVWSLAPGSASTLSSGSSVTLQWDNGHGLLFKRDIALDENYLFTVTQTVTNRTSSAVSLHPWHLISRHNVPTGFTDNFIMHEGPVANLDGKLKAPSYSDLLDGEKLEQENAQGWVGITDKYWFVGLFSDPQQKFNARIIGSKTGDLPTYQADIVGDAQTVQPGQSITDKKFVFAGVKNMPLLNSYQDKHGFKNMDLAFDFGIFYLITKPFFYLLHFLMTLTGNVGLAILCITVIIRAAVFPLASKSFRSMAGMKKIAPQLKELQAKYADNREKLQMEIFELYKKEDVNPFSGCWPLLVQIPIFFALYKAILLSVELRHAPFWGWINDLSAPDPTNIFNLFGLIPWNPPDFLWVGAWPVLYCITMIIERRLSPPMPDPTQEMLQEWFPYIITLMLAQFSVGLVIYWTFSNVLGILQQYYILRKVGGEKVSIIRGHSERQKKKPAKPPAKG
jgi:YidC/Oxa1 family membrane protein insertase